MTNAIVLAWDRPVPGREKMGNELLGMTTSFFEKQKAANTIESFEVCVLGPHGGDFNGFILVRGDPKKLRELIATDDFTDLSVRANYTLQGFVLATAYVGDALTDIVSRWQKLLTA